MYVVIYSMFQFNQCNKVRATYFRIYACVCLTSSRYLIEMFIFSKSTRRWASHRQGFNHVSGVPDHQVWSPRRGSSHCQGCGRVLRNSRSSGMVAPVVVFALSGVWSCFPGLQVIWYCRLVRGLRIVRGLIMFSVLQIIRYGRLVGGLF